MRSFGSDNNSGVHPRIIRALTEANIDHTIAYGDDIWTRQAEEEIRVLLEDSSIEPSFLFNGTGEVDRRFVERGRYSRWKANP